MDLTNLISTIISATAALVAIIGGFLVSRVITLSSERNSIVRRLREIDNELNTKKEMLASIKLVLLEDDVDDFVHNYAEDILVHGKDIKDILEDNNSIDLTEDELEPYIDDLDIIFNTLTNIIKNTDSSYKLPTGFDIFVKDNKIKIDSRNDWYEITYRIIYNHIPDEPQIDLRLGLMPPLRFPLASTAQFTGISNIKWYQGKVKEKNTLTDEVQILSGFKKEQVEILRDYGKVSGLWSGLSVLAYSTIVGIIIPTLLLPYPSDKYDDQATRTLLILLFFTALMALFIYLGISMYKLTRED